MLNHLSIKGLAIIEELNIDFTNGFCVITGETGAGKSILIKALNLLFGGKTSASSVRRGFEKATVCGHFLLSSEHEAIKIVDGLGIVSEVEDKKVALIIRRTLTFKGRSQAWINDVPVTSTSLRDVAESLVDIFGQHENTRLLDPTSHTKYLDQFISEKNLLQEIEFAHTKCMKSLCSLRSMITNYRDGQRSSDYLRFRLDELQTFSPSKEDYLKLQDDCKESEKILEEKEILFKVQNLIDENTSGDLLSKPLWDAHYLLNKLTSLDIFYEQLAKNAAEIATKIDDLSFDIGKKSQTFLVDESDIEEKQERLATYQELFRKMMVSGIDELLEEYNKLNSEIEFLESAAESASQEIKKLKKYSIELDGLSKILTKSRYKAAKIVKKRVEAEFNDLAMPGAVFDVNLEPSMHIVPDLDISIFGESIENEWADVCDLLSEQGASGAERANFMLSANPGEPVMALHKIASGGEVSRIMLALKKALLAGANTCILVFDEIDTGISGRVATMVGKKMKELSKDFQIICISHLPQVAAFADSHYLVHKFRNNQRTESTIVKLEAKESLEEIAKLLSGDDVSKSSIANAKSLVKKAAELA